MKNLLKEKPTDPLYGRLRETSRFVSASDVKRKRVLDIGCGFGWFEHLALKHGVTHVVGIEPTENDLKAARGYMKSSKVSFVESSAVKLPFKDNTFDTVVCFEVLEHIPVGTEAVMYSEIKRVLKDKGVLYLSTPYNSFSARVLDPAWWLSAHRHYSQETLTRLGRQIGFDLSEMSIKGGWWSIASLLNMYISKWIFGRRRIAERFFMEKEGQEYARSNGFVTIFVKYKISKGR